MCVCVCVGKYLLHPSALLTSHCDRIQILQMFDYFTNVVWLCQGPCGFKIGCCCTPLGALDVNHQQVFILLCPYGILSETRRSLLDYISDINEMGSVFQENCDKVVKTPSNSSFL